MMPWAVSYRAADLTRPLADRHYNRQSVGAVQFVPPGQCLVLRTVTDDAFWVTSWPLAEYVRSRGIYEGWIARLADVAGCDARLEVAATRCSSRPVGLRMIWFWVGFSWAVVLTVFALALLAKDERENVRLPRAERPVHVRIVHKDAA